MVFPDLWLTAATCRRGWVGDGIMAVLQFLTGKKMLWYMKDNIIIVHSFCWTQLFYVLMHSSQTAACPESLPVPREALQGSFHLGWTEHQVSGADCLSYIVYPCIMAVNLSLFVIKANVYSCPSVLLLMGSIQKTQWQLCYCSSRRTDWSNPLNGNLNHSETWHCVLCWMQHRVNIHQSSELTWKVKEKKCQIDKWDAAFNLPFSEVD